MLHLCPACQRTFPEPGFCPFDRTTLVVPRAGADKQTMLSEAMIAQDDPRINTHVEQRRETFPLTPTPLPLDEVTAARPRAPAAVPAFRAVSASDSASEALETFRAVNDSEYDKLVGQTLDGRYYIEKKMRQCGTTLRVVIPTSRRGASCHIKAHSGFICSRSRDHWNAERRHRDVVLVWFGLALVESRACVFCLQHLEADQEKQNAADDLQAFERDAEEAKHELPGECEEHQGHKGN